MSKSKNPIRSSSNPRVRTVMAVLSRCIASEARDEDSVSNAMSALFERFNMQGWPDDAIRAVLLAVVTNCPKADLEIIEEWAASEDEWRTVYELDWRYCQLTGKSLPNDLDAEALQRAIAGESKPAAVIGTVEESAVH